MTTVDLSQTSVRDLNQGLHDLPNDSTDEWEINGVKGQHAVAVGIDAPLSVTINGHAGYYAAGMNQHANVVVNGNVGVGVAENMMSGRVHVKGNASQSAGATSQGGMLIVDGDAAARCAISMKGSDIVVKGNVGHMSCFMGQSGRFVICGDAGDALGDSMYEVRIYVKGTVKSLGADVIEKDMRAEHLDELAGLLKEAGSDEDASNFKRYGSARNLYTFHIDNATL
jgi:methylamine---glutamate N-methyltransferase subunit B